MSKTNTEKLLTLVEEILDQENGAKNLYEEYLKRIQDKPIVNILTLLSNEEEKHVRLASEVSGLLRYGSTYSRIMEGLDRFSETASILISCSIENYLEVNKLVLSNLVNKKGMKCIYVTINKPSSSLVETLKREGIDTDKLSFVDCTTVDVETKGRIMARPDNLSDISISVSKLIKDIPSEKFVYIDAISTLYIFNPEDTVEKFVHHLISRLRLERTGLILVAVKEEMEKRSTAVLTSFCDGKIEV